MIYVKSKRIVSLILALIMIMTLMGCENDDEVEGVTTPVEILLVTDYGTINDGSFNQGAWEGMSEFSKKNGALIDCYQPENTDTESYLKAIERGIDNGAKIVVCPGYLLEEAVYKAQKDYPEVNFIILDGQPHNEDYSDQLIGDNTLSILFSEEEAGFLAGYAAVRDGYTNLGFIGGIPADAVIKYGYGFVQGADYAAIEMGVEVKIRYTYANTFDDTGDVELTASTWYEDNTEVIFACGGQLGRAVMRAAEKNNTKVIGVDVDQSVESEVVLTSAIKSLSSAVSGVLEDYYQGKYYGGQAKIFTAKEGGVCLPMDTSRFEKFTQEQYDNIYSRLVDGMIVPYGGTDIGTTQELTMVNTEVTYIVL